MTIIKIAIMITISPELCKKIQDNNVKSAKFEFFFLLFIIHSLFFFTTFTKSP